MNGRKTRFLVLLLALAAIAFTAVAQPVDGALTAGLPSAGQVSAGQALRFEYTVSETSAVAIQAAGDTLQPTLRVLSGGVDVAAESNITGQTAVSLNAVLQPGTYVVEVAGANGTSGQVVVAVQRETAITPVGLVTGIATEGLVNDSAPAALYEFGNLAEAAYLYVESRLPEWGVNVLITNVETGQIVGQSLSDVLGARFRFAPGTSTYQVLVSASGAGVEEPFSVCVALVSAGGCEGPVTTTEVNTPQPVATEEVTAGGCTVTPNVAGGVNIRQSASTGSIIVGALPGSAVATVLGIAPDNSFYNIQFNNITGWVAASVVNTAGDCANVATVNPPPVIAPPTATPPPTFTPVPATHTPEPPSGPCLITITSPTFVYTTTIELVDYLYDQVQSGELVPVGRTADGAWYKTNYGNAWLPTRVIGSTVSRSGNCNNLPVVTP
jgi:hypothetical protein